jgi:hypothetical protein
MQENVSRRGYLKQIGTGILAAAGVAAGAYFLSRPEITPPPIETTSSTSSSTLTLQTSTVASTITSAQTTTEALYSRQPMPDFWRGFWTGPGGWMPDSERPRWAEIGFDRLRERE